MTALEVVRAGARLLVEDGGRPGWRSQGVGRSGFADATSARLANRLVGNAEDEAVLESLLGDVVLRATGRTAIVAVIGAAAVSVASPSGGTRAADPFAVVGVPPGHVLQVGPLRSGVVAAIAVRGGVDVPPVLGSRSADTLSDLGPAPLQAGDRIPLGRRALDPPLVDAVPPEVATPTSGTVVLPLLPGPHTDDLTPDATARLLGGGWSVGSRADRVGVRLAGPALEIDGAATVASFGAVRGAVELPPDGLPIVLMADAPTTVGYPVIGVVEPRATHALAQARPGTPVRLARAPLPAHLAVITAADAPDCRRGGRSTR
jgi:biotin-dependent carboxylase-like uncharacterized protein